MAYEFKIGTSSGGMALLSSLKIVAPHIDPQPSSVTREAADGTEKQYGWPTDEWHWDFLSAANRALLRTYIPGKSAIIYVRTLKDDHITWQSYRAVGVWPPEPDVVAGRRLDFNLKLKLIEEIS